MTVETRPIQAPTEPRTKTVADVLRHAARIIEERGWCRVNFEDNDGRHCMVGAIYAADEDLAPLAHRTLLHFMGGMGAMNFNDTPGRTAAEVIAALNAAADEADR